MKNENTIRLTKEQLAKVKQFKKMYKELRKDNIAVLLDGLLGTLFFFNVDKVKGLVHNSVEDVPENTHWFDAYYDVQVTVMKLDPDMVIGLDEEDMDTDLFGIIFDDTINL